ncbi:two-partner secretion domain-containing protein [Leptolyngbya sp. GGD]|uniref:two-partner secretion domain-containing protein n=1 Tax=Leptolyngbya sp. GGD TaxID=2997907 RepID=UPI00227BCD30|nr:filamentous hemagglutinin N-terminal domain-containing protein [Leptolyngbya sp. GGD]MCY6494438.1 filamentous hemagglutinin N-terminal domain-containing protein [Leptolyngbya sp. GGD]
MKRLSFGFAIVICGMSAAPVWGQSAIVPDSTLGASNSTIQETTIRGLPSTLIQGGSSQGANLFHSFLRFNIPVGRGAYFANPDGIKNIFSRVTGAEGSEIFGRLGVLGDANLFLMNPNGILFGQTGSLDVNGSFVATTANAIQFGDRGSFDTANPPNSVLTIDPSAFLFTQVQAGAQIAASGGVLRVPSSQSLVLLGGDISLDREILSALGGQIELGGLIASGKVAISQEGKAITLSFPENLTRGNVTLQNQSIATVRTAKNSGNLAINARDVNILGNSQILAGTLQEQESFDHKAGNITVNATDNVNIRARSVIRNDVYNTQSGNAGDLNITARSLSLSDNSYLSSSTFGKGSAGNITIQTRENISLENQSLIFSRVGTNAIGQAGNIILDTSTLDLNNSSQLSAATFGEGDAGNILINARDRVLVRNGNSLNQSGIFSTVEENAIGAGGDIKITTRSLEMTRGGLITAGISGEGNGGDITINARDRIVLQGGIALSNGGFIPTAINNDARQGSIGEAGDINVETGALQLLNGAGLSSSTGGQGAAGRVILNVRDRASLNRSFIVSQVSSQNQESTERGGINIFAGTLELKDSRISTRTLSKGNAGNIILKIDNQATLDNSLIFSSIDTDAIGQSGDIWISAKGLELSNSSQLSSATFGKGSAGNIEIEVRDQITIKDQKPFGLLLNGIFSTVEKDAAGQGGDIRITTGSLDLKNGGQITASNAGTGDAGDVVINARDRITSTTGFRTATASNGTSFSFVFFNSISSRVGENGRGNAGDLKLSTSTLELFNETQLLSDTSGIGNAGNIVINTSDRVLFDSSFAKTRVSSKNAVGQGGDIYISTPLLELRNGAQIDASTFGQGDAGNITIEGTRSVLVAGAAENRFDGGYASAIFSTTGDTDRIGTGVGGNINIKSPLLIVGAGGIIDARTFNDKRGGNINLDLGTLEIVNGGQIFTTSARSGSAGTITINASEAATIAGIDSTYFKRVEQFGAGRVGSTSEKSSLSVFSSATGSAGNIILNAPRITIRDQAIISAESQATDGGNVTLSTDWLLLRRQGSISATAGLAAGAGNGGNININAQFIVAIPKENSDIIANAFQGSGGKIVINSQGIFGLESRTKPTALSDITASSNLGVTGTIAINAPDNGALQNGLAQLIQNSIDTNTLLANSCIVRDRTTGAFFIKGSSGLPIRPGDLALAPFPTGTIQPTERSNSEIVEPQGIYQLADGRYIMSRECQ